MQDTLEEILPDENEPKLPPVLDLDALEVVRVPVTLEGEVYYMKHKQDMSIADREELRLCLMQLADIQEADPGKDGQHTQGNRKALDDIERRLVTLAIPELPRKIINDEKVMTASKRNAIVERFFTEVDVLETVQSFVATMRRMNQKSRQQPQPSNVQPLRPLNGTPPLPPVDLLGRRPSSTTTPNETPTSN
jgi:hypothetical protein